MHSQEFVEKEGKPKSQDDFKFVELLERNEVQKRTLRTAAAIQGETTQNSR
jgi:hypothetical protein